MYRINSQKITANICCIAFDSLVKRNPSNDFNPTIMIEAKAQKGRNRLQNYQRPHGHILLSWRVRVKYFSIFSLTFSMQTRKWRWHVPQSKGLAFFLSASGAVEEALKTAKSSAAAANKYAIFLLSCLSGCQPFAVCRSLYSSLALPGPHPQPEPEQELEPELEQEPLPVLCRIQVGEATERQTKKSNKATDAYQCNLMSVYICSFHCSAFLSFFSTYSFWLNFNLIAVFCERGMMARGDIW